jgi:Concanavalin A-like lectin/glucanases superfamily
MALHDLWSYDNAPVGTNLVQASLVDQTKVTNTTTNPYNYYTQLPGCVMNNVGAGTPTAVSADGFLTFQRTASGTCNPMWFQLNQVFNFTGITRWAFGFRTKSSAVTAASSAIRIFTTAAGWNGALAGTLIVEGDVAAPANTEVYVEGIVDLTAGTFTVFANGNFVRSVAFSASGWSSALYVMVDTGGSAGVAGSTRGYRDFYFLDLDSVDTTRLGPIRSSRAALTNVSGSDWTLNSSPDLATALSTVLQNPPISTPSASSPSDNQALSVSLNTSLPVSTNIIAVQPQLTLITDSNGNNIDLAIKQSINTIDTGVIALPASTTAFNQRLAIQRVAPDGGVWTPTKINATQLVLTPSVLVNTVLLLHGDGTNGSTIVPDSARAHVMACVTGAGISTTQKKFGTGSMSIPAGTAITSPDQPDLQLAADFTIEMFVNLSDTSAESMLCSKSVGSYFDHLNGQFYISLGTANVKLMIVTSGLVAGTWAHVALTRSGTTVTLWVNGVSIGTATSSLAWGPTADPLYVGGYAGISSISLKGFIDEFRISKIARYTAPFTPPSAPFALD